MPRRCSGISVVQLGEALDVQLVDHGVAPPRAASAGRRPSRSRRATTTLRGIDGAESAVAADVRVARRRGRAAPGPAVELAGDRPGVRVEQQLVRVEPQAVARVPRPVGAEAVALADGRRRAAAPCQTPRVCSVSWCRVSAPSSSNRQTQTAVASGAEHREVRRRPAAQVAPSVLVPPGPHAERSRRARVHAQRLRNHSPHCVAYGRCRGSIAIPEEWRGDTWASSCVSRWPTASAPSGSTGRR